jgi:hypothetical protein
MPVGGTEAVTGGIETPLASGLATAEQLTGEPLTGAAVQPTALTPPLPTLEQAQAVLDTLENKEQLEIQGTPDGGFVVAQRAPVVEPTIQADPVETGEVTTEAEPVAAVNPVQTTLKDGEVITIEPVSTPSAFSSLVRAEYGDPISLVAKNDAGEEVGRLTYMPNGGPIDVSVAEKERRRGIGSALYDALEEAGGKIPAAESGVAISKEAQALRESRKKKPTEEPSVAEALETVEAKEERPQETAATVAAIAEQAEAPVRKRAPGGGRKKSEAAMTPAERKADTAATNQDRRNIEALAKETEELSRGYAPERFRKRGMTAEQAQAAYEAAESKRKSDLWNNKMALYIMSVDPLRRDIEAGNIARAAVAKFTPQEQAQYKKLYDSYKAEQRGATRLSQETAKVQANGTPEERQVQAELTGKPIRSSKLGRRKCAKSFC